MAGLVSAAWFPESELSTASAICVGKDFKIKKNKINQIYDFKLIYIYENFKNIGDDYKKCHIISKTIFSGI